MNGLVGWFAKNSVASNLLMAILLIGGAMSMMFDMRVESFPEIEPSMITVSVLYPGATPEEVEESICLKIEDAVQSVEDVKEVTANANENMGVVSIEIVDGADIGSVMDDVKVEIDAIDTFPVDAEEPIITQQKVEERVLALAVSGPVSPREVRLLADRMRDELLILPEISKVELEGAADYEIGIEIDEDALRRFGLSFEQVAGVVRGFSINLPAGSIKSDTGEILLRSNRQAYDRRDFEQLPVITRPDGAVIRLGDVATVVEGLAETDQETRIDGQTGLVLQIYRVGTQTTPDLARATLDHLDTLRSKLPAGVELTVWENRATDLQDRMDLLERNGKVGLLLVFIVLALFLRAGLALWVAIGLSTAICGALWVLPWVGVSLNFLSSFGFILVLGILVDDAIVVAENIDSHRTKFKKSPQQAAIDGTREVLLPVSLAVITTGFAFSPMLSMPGRTGEFTKTIAVVVIVAMFFSLVESLLILPSHLGHGTEGTQKRSAGVLQRAGRRLSAPFAPIGRVIGRIQGACAGLLQTVVNRVYVPTLDFAMQRRYLVAAIGVSFLIVTGGIVAGGWLKISFFPPIEGNQVVAAVKLPVSASADATRRAVEVLESAAQELRAEIEDEEPGGVIRFVRSSIADQPGVRASQPPHNASGPGSSNGYLGEVALSLTSSEVRAIQASEIADRWKAKVGDRIPEATELLFVSDQMNTGAPINVELSGNSIDELEAAATELMAKIETYPGTFNLSDDYDPGKMEFEVEINSAGLAMGLTQADVARQVRQAFYGEEAQRVQIGRDDVKVFVRYPREARESLATLSAFRLRMPNGHEVPFSEVAEMKVGQGPASIRRLDRRRTIVVTSDLNRSVANANEVVEDLRTDYLPQLGGAFPGIQFRFGGEQERQSESFASLASGMVLALFMMYALLAIVFKSYTQPFIVLGAVPFGIAGAFWAHFFLGMDVTFLSFIGVLALMGVVVNDSLVLIDFINRYRREEGKGIEEALREAGPRRFRPIVLTSMTTFAGITPILLERSMQAAFVIPMAVSLAFGVAFATIIILVMVPATYMILEDGRNLVLGAPVQDEDPEPSLEPTG